MTVYTQTSPLKKSNKENKYFAMNVLQNIDECNVMSCYVKGSVYCNYTRDLVLYAAFAHCRLLRRFTKGQLSSGSTLQSGGSSIFKCTWKAIELIT